MSKPTAKKASPKKTRGSDSKENFFDRTIGNDEKRYRLLAENLTDVIWVLDLQLKHTYVSPSVERLRGYPPEEAVRQSLEEFLTPDSHKKVLDIFSREFSQETQGQRHAREWTQSIEVEMLRKDGSTIWTEVKASLLYDDHGRPEGILGITRDISERKKTEQALKKSEEYTGRSLNTRPPPT